MTADVDSSVVVSLGLPVCLVRTADFDAVGFLFMRTPTHVVLLNNMREGADLGPLKATRTEHIEPEADVRVIPSAMVESITEIEATQ